MMAPERFFCTLFLCVVDIFKIKRLSNSMGNYQIQPLEKEMAILPGEVLGHRSLVGYSPWGHKESDTTKQLTHIHIKYK